MPRGDGTGPQGKVSGLSRGLGKCIKKTKAADADRVKGSGTAGRGLGQSGKGMQGKN
ncbi:hypothetical protein ASZ90_019283 [hydrocarbon metagenome]|uniref:Uncharacterized protein n=1 Tax=hydrocarbon metagenome TaxID=938273 RepID=A0A0W8E3T6_9ZZZZ